MLLFIPCPPAGECACAASSQTHQLRSRSPGTSLTTSDEHTADTEPFGHTNIWSNRRKQISMLTLISERVKSDLPPLRLPKYLQELDIRPIRELPKLFLQGWYVLIRVQLCKVHVVSSEHDLVSPDAGLAESMSRKETGQVSLTYQS